MHHLPSIYNRKHKHLAPSSLGHTKSLMDNLCCASQIKKEPVEDSTQALLNRPKPSASPAQEATRGRIASFEAQLKRLYRLRNSGKLDATKGAIQIRCLEDDLRKAHSKLRRLLNEAERQRRRRERLRSGVSIATRRFMAPTTDLDISPLSAPSPDDRSIMSALRGCDKFEDFARELHSLGFSLTRMNSEPGEMYGDQDSDADIEGVKVQVELIEGDAPLLSPHDDREPKMTVVSDSDESSENDPIDQDLEQRSSSSEAPCYSTYQEWLSRQQQQQQQWEEAFMREQMQLAKSTLEAVTAAFLNGIQQVMQNVTAARRFSAPFCPPPPFHHPHHHPQSRPTRTSRRRKK